MKMQLTILSFVFLFLLGMPSLVNATACTNEWLGGACFGDITYTHSNTLTSFVNASGNVIINSGVTITTGGYGFILNGCFINSGTINVGLQNNGGAAVGTNVDGNPGTGNSLSFGGSGASGNSGNTHQSGAGGNTLATGGLAAGSGNNNGNNGAQPSAPVVTNANILIWAGAFGGNFVGYFSGAGGGSGGSDGGAGGNAGMVGSNGLYVQATNIYIGTVNAVGTSGPSDPSHYAGGGGGGSIVLLSYFSSVSSTAGVNVAGGTGGVNGGRHGGDGAAGRVITYNYATPPLPVITAAVGITMAPGNSVTYGTNVLITATVVPNTDNVAVDSPLGTHLCTGIGTCSFTANYLTHGVGSYVFYPNDITSGSPGTANTLVVNSGVVPVTISNCTNQAWTNPSLGASCTTTATFPSINNQVAGNLLINNVVVMTSNAVSNSVSYTVSNAISCNVYKASSPATTNYLANSIQAQSCIYVPISLKNASSTLTLTATFNALTTASNTLTGWHLPIEFSTASPSNTITFTVSNAYYSNTIANVPSQVSVSNVLYFPNPLNKTTGTWIFLIAEKQYGNTIYSNQVFNPLTQNFVYGATTNGIYTCFRYFPCFADNGLTFYSSPTSYKIDGYANSIIGTNIIKGTNSPTSLPLNYQLTYSQFTTPYIVNLTSALGLTTNSMNVLPFNFITNNGVPAAPNTRKVLDITTFDQHSLAPLLSNTIVVIGGLFNNWTIANQSSFSGNAFQLYMPLSNFQNPALSLITTTLSSSAASHFLANNNYCPTILTNGNYMTLKPYLVDLNGSLYTFNIYSGYATGGGNDFMWVMDGINNASAINVQQIRIVSSPFALALENGQSYAFRFYDPNCNFISSSNYSIWSNPISLNLPSNANVPTIKTANVTTTCTKTPVTQNTMSVTCTGTDTSNLVSSWSMQLYNVSSISGWTVFNSINASTASFSQTFTPLSNYSPLQVVMTWRGSGFSGSKPYQFNQNVIQGGLNIQARGFIILLALLVGLGIGVAGAKSGTIEAVHAPSTTIIIEAVMVALLFMVGLLSFIPNYATIGLLCVMIFVAVQSHRHESGGG